jgi:hypothetical protein
MKRRNAPINNPVAAWLVIAAITLVGLMATQPALAHVEQEPPCTLATLNGLYIFDATGYIITPVGSVPKAVVQFLYFNGDGTLTTIGTANVGGNVVASDLHLSGTYTVNEDCTGARIEGQRHFELFIAPKGATLHMIETDAGNVLAGEARRVSR